MISMYDMLYYVVSHVIILATATKSDVDQNLGHKPKARSSHRHRSLAAHGLNHKNLVNPNAVLGMHEVNLISFV